MSNVPDGNSKNVKITSSPHHWYIILITIIHSTHMWNTMQFNIWIKNRTQTVKTRLEVSKNKKRDFNLAE